MKKKVRERERKAMVLTKFISAVVGKKAEYMDLAVTRIRKQ